MGNTTSTNEKEIIDITNCEYERISSGKRQPIINKASASTYKKARPNDYLADHRPSLNPVDDSIELNLSSEVLDELRATKTPSVISWLKYAVKTGNFRKVITKLSPQFTPLALQERQQRQSQLRRIDTIDLTEEDRENSVQPIHEDQNGKQFITIDNDDELIEIDDNESDEEVVLISANSARSCQKDIVETPKINVLKPSRWRRTNVELNPWLATMSFTNAGIMSNSTLIEETAERSNVSSSMTSEMIRSGVNLAERDRFEKMVRLTQSPAAYSNRVFSAVAKPQTSPKSSECIRVAESRNNTNVTPIITLGDDENDHTPSTSATINIADSAKLFEKNNKICKETLEGSENVANLIKELEKSSLSNQTAREAYKREQLLRQERVERERRARQEKRNEEIRSYIVGKNQLIIPERPIDYDYIDLDPTHLSLIDDAWNKAKPANENMVHAFNLDVKRSDLLKLHRLEWLNDEIVNFYFEMIADRPKRSCAMRREPLPKIHAFNTFFYGKLVPTYQFDRVKRWTRKIDIFSYDMLLIPVHLGMHWCLAVVDMRFRLIRYFDSMGGLNNDGMKAILRYLSDESNDKLKKALDVENWEIRMEQDIPRQLNGSDCGVFSCKFADFVSRDKCIDFTQENMPYFRRRMVVEILQKHLIAQY